MLSPAVHDHIEAIPSLDVPWIFTEFHGITSTEYSDGIF